MDSLGANGKAPEDQERKAGRWLALRKARKQSGLCAAATFQHTAAFSTASPAQPLGDVSEVGKAPSGYPLHKEGPHGNTVLSIEQCG